MRLLYVFIICIFAYGNVLAANLLPLDKDGFGGIKWGTEYSDKLGMKECVDYVRDMFCIKDNESLTEIGGVPVEVAYLFEGLYFTNVRIVFDDPLQWPTIINALAKAYGKSKTDGLSYNKTLGKAKISGQYYYDTMQELYITAADRSTDAKINDAVVNRFDKMASSAFIEAERRELNGFLGAKWGMTAEQIPHKLLLAKTDKNKKIYIQSENVYFSYMPMSSIEYEFVNDKLDTIRVYSKPPIDVLDYPWALSLFLFVQIIELNFGEMGYEDDHYQLILPNTSISVGIRNNGSTYIRAYQR